MKIKIKLKDIMKNDRLVFKIGLNPWCMNEGLNGEVFYEIEVENDIEILNKVVKGFVE